jgi:RHS repeat-associated protein
VLDSSTVATYRLAYDDIGRLARVDDPEGNAQTMTYDLGGRLIETSDADRGTVTREYDAAGLLVASVDARGVRVINEHDALNRPVATYEAANPAATREETRYDYDAACADCENTAGGVVGASTAGGYEVYSYDERGRLARLTRVIDDVPFVTTWAYDGADQPVEIGYPDGQRLTFEYDVAQRPVRIPGFVDGVSYNEFGDVASVDYANGVVGTWGYDALQRRVALSFDDFYDVTRELDRAGNVVAEVSAGSGLARDKAHTYDAWYRPTSSTLAGDETVAVEYSLADNVLRKTSSRGADSPAHVGDYDYGGVPAHGLSNGADVARSHDESGNVTARGDLSLEWDHLDRLISAASGGDEVATFAYNRDRQRVQLSDEGVTYYPVDDFVVRDGISTVYARLGAIVVGRSKSAALATTLLADGDDDGDIDIADAALGRGGDDEGRLLRASARRLLFTSGDASAALHQDLGTSIVAATDEAGAVIAERDFHAFGSERASTGFVDERGFTGQERDLATGLVAFEQRYLDAEVGQWLSPDPAFAALDLENVDELGESTNPYAYVGNHAINRTDPFGLKSKKGSKKGQVKKSSKRKKSKRRVKNGRKKKKRNKSQKRLHKLRKLERSADRLALSHMVVRGEIMAQVDRIKGVGGLQGDVDKLNREAAFLSSGVMDGFDDDGAASARLGEILGDVTSVQNAMDRVIASTDRSDPVEKLASLSASKAKIESEIKRMNGEIKGLEGKLKSRERRKLQRHRREHIKSGGIEGPRHAFGIE